MIILAIETSCDDTCAAILENDRVLSSVISSQTDLHAKWGGVVPDIAKRAHMENIEPVIAQAIKRGIKTISPNPSLQTLRPTDTSLDRDALKKIEIQNIIENGMKKIDVIAVTQGSGLAIALGIGVNKAKELAIKYNKKLVAVNHIEGHILANLAKNKNGKPERNIEFPALALTVSGGHTKIVLMEQNSSNQEQTLRPTDTSLDREAIEIKFKYTVVGETLDDAAGEALDKAGKLLGLGYPGGPIIERLAKNGDKNFLELPRPLANKAIPDYSFSGLKTSFYYKIKDWSKEDIANNLENLSASFQNAVFETLIRKYKLAIINHKPKTLLASGGVLSNMELRKQLRKMAKEFKLPIFMPNLKYLNTDNAAMIGVAAYYKALRNEFVEDKEALDREPRMKIC